MPRDGFMWLAPVAPMDTEPESRSHQKTSVSKDVAMSRDVTTMRVCHKAQRGHVSTSYMCRWDPFIWSLQDPCQDPPQCVSIVHVQAAAWTSLHNQSYALWVSRSRILMRSLRALCKCKNKRKHFPFSPFFLPPMQMPYQNPENGTGKQKKRQREKSIRTLSLSS